MDGFGLIFSFSRWKMGEREREREMGDRKGLWRWRREAED
jgi:hypothetical protein